MKVFLAALSGHWRYYEDILENVDYVLESFYGIEKKPFILEKIKKKKWKMFLLDSGAFTFMNSFKGTVNWEKYINSYIDFINKYDIQYFFELDIDVIVGYENVKKIRKYIEQRTGKKCIPVWHKSRGLDEFIAMCKEYDYVSIGGIVIGEITRADYKYFPQFIKIAHENNCKIHGLGFTNTKELQKYQFDTVDSTSWLAGQKFGQLQQFNGKYMDSKVFKNKRVHDLKAITRHNIQEWLKYQKYADRCL